MGFDNECIVNIQSLPGEFFCPVCRTLVYPHEALQAQCTHLYCKPCLAYVVATTQACPYDGFLVTEADSKPVTESSKSVAESIGKVAVHCLYYRSGCQWQGTLAECTVHSTDCSFGNSLVVCNRCGAQIIHRQVQEHAQSCPGLQPQAQQAESTQAQVSSVPAQATTQNSSSAVAQAASAATAPTTAVTAPATDAAITPSQAPASTAAVPPPSAPAAVQTQTVAQTPTSDQWYQQQLQYQQYYQQYPGYDAYQQQYQQYGQYQQQVYQNYPYAQPPTQQQPLPYAVPPSQAQPQPQSLPQTQQPAQPQLPLQQPLPQAQQQYQPHPQTQAYPHPRPLQMQATQAHVPPPVQGQPQPQGPQPQSYPAPLQHQPHPQMQPPPHTQLTAQAQPLPNMQMQHIQAQPQFQHPPQPNVPQQPRAQLQAQSQPMPQPQTQPGAPVSGYQSYPQPQPFQQFPHSAPQQPHMQIPLQHPGPPQQQPQFPPQQNPQMRPSQAHMPMQPPQQLTAMPSQGRWPMQQQPPSVPPQPGQPPQYPPSLRPPVQQQLPNQPYQHAMHPPSHPQGLPYHQHNLPQMPRSHQPQGPPGRSMMSNQGVTHQALQQSAGLNHQVQSILVPAAPAVQPGTSGQDMLDKKLSPKVADANIASNFVNGVSEVSESADANGKDGKEKPVMSDSQIPSKGSESLAKDEKVPDSKRELAGEAGMIERRQSNGITNLKKEVEVEDEVGHPSTGDKVVGSNDTHDLPRMQEQVPAPGRDSGFPQRPPHQDSISGHSRPFAQPGYLVKNLPPEGPNSGPSRYPPHQVTLGNQPANLGQGFPPHGPSPDKAFPLQMPYASQERKFMDPQFHPPPFGPNQIRPPMQHIPENVPPQGPPRGFEQQVMASQLHGPGHFPPSFDSGSRVPQGGPVAPPVLGGPPTGAFNSLSGRPSDHPRRHSGHFFDDKGPMDPSSLHDIREERLKPNQDGRFRPLPEESLKMAPQERVIPSMFEEDLKRFPRPSRLNGDPQFEPYASLSRPLDRVHDPRSRSLDRAPYGADGGFSIGGRRNHFVPPNDSERFRDVGDARGDVVRPLSEIGLHRLDGQPSSKFGSMSQYYNEDFYRRDLHGASAFYGSRIPEHFGPGSSLLPPHIHRSNFDHPDNMRIDAPDFPHSHFHEPFGHGFPNNLRSGEVFRVGEPGFARSYMLGDSFEHSRKRKPGSMGWCRICKIDCETVEGLDMHAQTREHQKMAMDMVLIIKREVSKKKLSGGSFSPENAIKARKANFEHRATRQ